MRLRPHPDGVAGDALPPAAQLRRSHEAPAAGVRSPRTQPNVCRRVASQQLDLRGVGSSRAVCHRRRQAAQCAPLSPQDGPRRCRLRRVRRLQSDRRPAKHRMGRGHQDAPRPAGCVRRRAAHQGRDRQAPWRHPGGCALANRAWCAARAAKVPGRRGPEALQNLRRSWAHREDLRPKGGRLVSRRLAKPPPIGADRAPSRSPATAPSSCRFVTAARRYTRRLSGHETHPRPP